MELPESCLFPCEYCMTDFWEKKTSLLCIDSYAIHSNNSLWARSSKNPDVSTGPLTCPFVVSRLLARFAAFTHLLARLLRSPSLVGKWMIRWPFFLLFRTIVQLLDLLQCGKAEMTWWIRSNSFQIVFFSAGASWKRISLLVWAVKNQEEEHVDPVEVRGWSKASEVSNFVCPFVGWSILSSHELDFFKFKQIARTHLILALSDLLLLFIPDTSMWSFKSP